MAMAMTEQSESSVTTNNAHINPGTSPENPHQADAMAKLNGASSTAQNIDAIRTRIQASFGQVVLAMTAVPRYRHLALSDLTHLVIEPLIRNRVAIASPKPKEEHQPQGPLAGIALWATVSEEVHAKIQEQIKAKVFPIRLKPEEWTSGDITWLLDIIAPTQQVATTVLTQFRQVAKTDQIRLHPLVAGMVDPELLKKMGTKTAGPEENGNSLRKDSTPNAEE